MASDQQRTMQVCGMGRKGAAAGCLVFADVEASQEPFDGSMSCRSPRLVQLARGMLLARQPLILATAFFRLALALQINI